MVTALSENFIFGYFMSEIVCNLCPVASTRRVTSLQEINFKLKSVEDCKRLSTSWGSQVKSYLGLGGLSLNTPLIKRLMWGLSPKLSDIINDNAARCELKEPKIFFVGSKMFWKNKIMCDILQLNICEIFLVWQYPHHIL